MRASDDLARARRDLAVELRELGAESAAAVRANTRSRSARPCSPACFSCFSSSRAGSPPSSGSCSSPQRHRRGLPQLEQAQRARPTENRPRSPASSRVGRTSYSRAVTPCPLRAARAANSVDRSWQGGRRPRQPGGARRQWRRQTRREGAALRRRGRRPAARRLNIGRLMGRQADDASRSASARCACDTTRSAPASL